MQSDSAISVSGTATQQQQDPKSVNVSGPSDAVETSVQGEFQPAGRGSSSRKDESEHEPKPPALSQSASVDQRKDSARQRQSSADRGLSTAVDNGQEPCKEQEESRTRHQSTNLQQQQQQQQQLQQQQKQPQKLKAQKQQRKSKKSQKSQRKEQLAMQDRSDAVHSDEEQKGPVDKDSEDEIIQVKRDPPSLPAAAESTKFDAETVLDSNHLVKRIRTSNLRLEKVKDSQHFQWLSPDASFIFKLCTVDSNEYRKKPTANVISDCLRSSYFANEFFIRVCQKPAASSQRTIPEYMVSFSCKFSSRSDLDRNCKFAIIAYAHFVRFSEVYQLRLCFTKLSINRDNGRINEHSHSHDKVVQDVKGPVSRGIFSAMARSFIKDRVRVESVNREDVACLFMDFAVFIHGVYVDFSRLADCHSRRAFLWEFFKPWFIYEGLTQSFKPAMDYKEAVLTMQDATHVNHGQVFVPFFERFCDSVFPSFVSAVVGHSDGATDAAVMSFEEAVQDILGERSANVFKIKTRNCREGFGMCLIYARRPAELKEFLKRSHDGLVRKRNELGIRVREFKEQHPGIFSEYEHLQEEASKAEKKVISLKRKFKELDTVNELMVAADSVSHMVSKRMKVQAKCGFTV